MKVRAVSNSRLEGPWRSGRGPGDTTRAPRQAPKKANHLSSKVALLNRECCDSTGESRVEEDRVRNNRRSELRKCLRNDVKKLARFADYSHAVAERTRNPRGGLGSDRPQRKEVPRILVCLIEATKNVSTNYTNGKSKNGIGQIRRWNRRYSKLIYGDYERS